MFQELKVQPTLTAGDHKQLDFLLQKRPEAIKMASEPLSSRERHPLPRTQMKKITQDPGHRIQIEKHWSADERLLGELLDCSSI